MIKFKAVFDRLLTFGTSDKEKTNPPTEQEIKDTSNKNKGTKKNEKVQRKRSSLSSKSRHRVLPPPKRPVHPSKQIYSFRFQIIQSKYQL